MSSYLTAKLVGEGFAKPDAEKELPIDINYAKLNEWLVDRKQVPADWNRKLQAIQAKAAEAARELPPGFLGQFEGGEDAPLDYFLAQRVLAKLSETAEKSLLGGLKGAAGAWDKVVKAYEYNLMFAAEAAQALCRNADYEIPFLKKQAAKCQQQLADLERRKGEARKSAAAAAADFQQECSALGIDGGDIRGGLLGLTAELPTLAGAAVEALQADGITQGITYYSAVVEQQQQGQQEGQQQRGCAAELLPVLREVREGRTQAPAAAVADTPATDSAAGGGLAVDWDLGAALEAAGGGDMPAGEAAAAGGISWDLGGTDLVADAGDGGDAAAAPGISWEVEALPAEAGAEAETDAAPAGADADSAPGAAEVSWDIGVSGRGEAAAARAAQLAGGGRAAAVAVEEPAVVRRLVGDAAYRARLLDDLFELRAFLQQRCRELSSRSSELLLAAAAGEAERHISADVAAAMREAVDSALAQLSGDKLKQLIALRTSSHYLDRLAAGLQQRAAQEAKFHRAAADAEARRTEIQRQLMADSAKLALLVQRTRQAKEGVEAALGAKLGRRINVMGEINQLL